MAESCDHPCLSLNSFGWCKDVLTCNSLQVDIHLLSIIIFSQSLAARRYSFCVHFLIIFLRLFDIDQVIVALSHHYRSVNEVICHGIPDARYMFSVFYFFASSILGSEIILLKNVIVVTLLDWGFYVKLWLNF